MSASDPITNELGEVAIRYYQPAQVFAQSTPTQTDYFFDVKAGVSMAWVKPEDVANLLARRGGCCNGKRQKYDYANQAAVDLWMR